MPGLCEYKPNIILTLVQLWYSFDHLVQGQILAHSVNIDQTGYCVKDLECSTFYRFDAKLNTLSLSMLSYVINHKT